MTGRFGEVDRAAAGLGMLAACMLMCAGCPLFPAEPEPLPAPPAEPVVPPAPSKPPAQEEQGEPPEAALPKGQYRGVAGLRPTEAGQCAERYALLGGVCAHERLVAMESKRSLRRLIDAFKRGATSPIVADAPARPRLEPGEMEPGALVARREQPPAPPADTALAFLQENGSEQSSTPSGAPVAPDEDGSRADEGDGQQVVWRFLRDYREIGQMDDQLRMLNQYRSIAEVVQKMTADGELSQSERAELDQLVEASPEMVPLKEIIDVYTGAGLEGLSPYEDIDLTSVR